MGRAQEQKGGLGAVWGWSAVQGLEAAGSDLSCSEGTWGLVHTHVSGQPRSLSHPVLISWCPPKKTRDGVTVHCWVRHLLTATSRLLAPPPVPPLWHQSHGARQQSLQRREALRIQCPEHPVGSHRAALGFTGRTARPQKNWVPLAARALPRQGEGHHFFLFLDTAFFLTCLGTFCLRRSALAALTCGAAAQTRSMRLEPLL